MCPENNQYSLFNKIRVYHCTRVSIGMKRHYDHGICIKGKIFTWEDMQADKLLKKYLSVLHLYLQETGSSLRYCAQLEQI